MKESNEFTPLTRSQRIKNRIHEVIFEADTFWGKVFDVALLTVIVFSIIILMLESVGSIQAKYHHLFFVLEWIFTALFTIEYILRLYSSLKPVNYMKSFYGIIDLIAIAPSYIEFFYEGTHFLLMIRVLRLLRVFRVFKLIKFIDERNILFYSLKASWRKISYFLFFILITVCVIGTLMYLVEGMSPSSGFVNIPISIYWCIVTLTTVGYGDISPVTPLGQFLASVVMILGYAIIAIPTGIITAEIARPKEAENIHTQVCQNCYEEHHLPDSRFCHRCGEKLY